MQTPSLTVITVVRNDPEGLQLSAQSLVNQTTVGVEWLVIDGSDDALKSEMQAIFSQVSLPNSRFLDRKPEGIYDAMNFALNNTEKDWVIFLNAGDFFYSADSLGHFKKALDKNPDVKLFAFSVAIQTRTGLLIDVVVPRTVSHNGRLHANMNHQGVFLQTQWAKSLGGFNSNLKLAADSLLLDNSINQSKPVLYNSVCSTFVIGGSSSSNFRRTLTEISTYREGCPTGLTKEYLIFKTWVRLKLFDRTTGLLAQVLLNKYLKKRDARMRNLANSLK